ncbi:hypothetical protein [Virgibacillus litoralis]|uniref:CBS domain-containing protein n=1 Tax=Virgibacillus litoralis TaxID=578221 RepID=A0ABS4H8Z5_9BACI|nr:hypothetical protein [Virgibacillus litoralis]MBP1947129.1 hypothetical protein [Virgibacillus litoralis]
MEIVNPAFDNFFTAKHIAEPIVSVTKNDLEKIDHFFNNRNFDVLAFREKDSIIGYIEKQQFTFDNWTDYIHKFDIKDLVSVNTPLFECIQLLKKQDRLFIIDRSSIIAIITTSDLEKPAVRMLFYGLITSFESSVALLIKKLYPNDTWKNCLNEGRVKKAQEEYNKLMEKNRENDLLDCTQFCDKTDILLNDNNHLDEYIDLSKTKATKLFRDSRKLRDDLSHAQPLYNTWFELGDIFYIAENLHHILDRIKQENSDDNSYYY